MKTYDLCNIHEGHVVGDIVSSMKNHGKVYNYIYYIIFLCVKLKFVLLLVEIFGRIVSPCFFYRYR